MAKKQQHRFVPGSKPKFQAGDRVKIVNVTGLSADMAGGIATIKYIFPPDEGGFLYGLTSTPADAWHYCQIYEADLMKVIDVEDRSTPEPPRVVSSIPFVDAAFTKWAPEKLAKIEETLAPHRREGVTFTRQYGKCATCPREIDPETEFRNALSVKEYKITGMCQKCQDDIYGAEN